jgi:hypothetical protein
MITYRATNTRNGKFYIGSATDFERKKHSFESRLKRSEKLKGRPNENTKGSKWWVNLQTGETKMLHNDPGEGWIPGRKIK